MCRVRLLRYGVDITGLPGRVHHDVCAAAHSRLRAGCPQDGDLVQNDAWLEFSQRVSCEARWCVDCVIAESPLPAAEIQRLSEYNANVLATIAALEERRSETVDDANPLLQEMMRLDVKLTALVDIVNRLLLPAGGLPARQLVRFNTAGAMLPIGLLPAGDALLLRLHPDACPSLPLEFPAVVVRRFDDGLAFVAFVKLGDTTSDALERLVFRLHRRKVAETRQSAQ
jgi:hypothetical protein